MLLQLGWNLASPRLVLLEYPVYEVYHILESCFYQALSDRAAYCSNLLKYSFQYLLLPSPTVSDAWDELIIQNGWTQASSECLA